MESTEPIEGVPVAGGALNGHQRKISSSKNNSTPRFNSSGGHLATPKTVSTQHF